MSFSKAKIQRFNERGSEAPPPGAYDPKFDTKVKGFSIEKKTERFQDNRSVVSSSADCSKSVSSRGIGPIIPSPKFRTPQLPKKRSTKPLSGSCPKAKTKLVLSSKELKYDTRDELADLKVECVNKDKTILENEKYIESMKAEIQQLEKNLEQSRQKQNDIEDQQKRDLETMANLQQDVLNTREQKYNQELDLLRTQLLELSREKEIEISKLLSVERELEVKISELMKKNRLLENDLQKQNEENDEITRQLQQLEAQAQLRESEYIEKLNDMENEKEVIESEWKETIAENEKEILEAYSEMRHLRKTLKEQEVKLLSLEESRDFFQSEYERLQEETEDLNRVRCDLENALESRQQVVLDLQCQLSSVQCEMDMLKAEHERYIENSEKKIAGLIEEHVMVTNRMEHEINEEKNKHTKNEHHIANIVLTQELQDFQMMYEDVKMGLQNVQVDLGNNADKSEFESCDTSMRQQFQDIGNQYFEEVEIVTTKNRDEVSENINNAGEEKDRQDERLVDCLAEAVVDKISLAEKLRERDAELEKLSTAFNELRCNSATQESFCQSLQNELDRAEGELAETKKELKDLKQQIREESAEMVTRRRRFEVIMADNQATVGALSVRLAEGNAEVERLEKELIMSKELVREHQDLLKALQKSSAIVNEQTYSLISQMDNKKDLIDQLEINSLADIETLRKLFEGKIDQLKQSSEMAVLKIEDACKKKDDINVKLKHQLDEMAEKLRTAQNMLLVLEEESDAQCIEISELQLAKEKLVHLLRIRTAECKHTKALLDKEIQKQKSSSQQEKDQIDYLIQTIEELKQDLSDYENLKSSFEKQKCTIGEEKFLRRKAEEERNKLTESNQNLQKNYQEMTKKLEEMIGHESHKQKIKHSNQLKEKITNLEKDLDEKSRVIDQQSKTIERLQADEKRRLTFTKGKENLPMSQISKSPFGTPVSSPHKPLTPLRDRNE